VATMTPEALTQAFQAEAERLKEFRVTCSVPRQHGGRQEFDLLIEARDWQQANAIAERYLSNAAVARINQP
jgi:cobalamin biosynthesis Mg chelatase CobN